MTNLNDFIGASKSLTRLREMAGKVAPTKLPLMIMGEAGTGKSRLAGIICGHGSESIQLINLAALDPQHAHQAVFGMLVQSETTSGYNNPASPFFQQQHAFSYHKSGGLFDADSVILKRLETAPTDLQTAILEVITKGKYWVSSSHSGQARGNDHPDHG